MWEGLNAFTGKARKKYDSDISNSQAIVNELNHLSVEAPIVIKEDDVH